MTNDTDRVGPQPGAVERLVRVVSTMTMEDWLKVDSTIRAMVRDETIVGGRTGIEAGGQRVDEVIRDSGRGDLGRQVGEGIAATLRASQAAVSAKGFLGRTKPLTSSLLGVRVDAAQLAARVLIASDLLTIREFTVAYLPFFQFAIPEDVPTLEGPVAIRNSPFLDYAQNMVQGAVDALKEAVSYDPEFAEDQELSSEQVIRGITEFLYFELQLVQRIAGSRLTDTQMRTLIPAIFFEVFDRFVDRFMPLVRLEDGFEEFRAAWINAGADRNDTYSHLVIMDKADRGRAGDLFWEASKIITESVGLWDGAPMFLPLSLYRLLDSLPAEPLVAAAADLPA